MLAVKRGYLLIYFLEDLLQRLINALIFRLPHEIPTQFDGKVLRTILGHLFSAVTVENCEQATILVVIKVISVATRILLAFSEILSTLLGARLG